MVTGAARSKRTAKLPADQGSRAEPKIPRAAIVARRSRRCGTMGEDEIGDAIVSAQRIENAVFAEAADVAAGLEEIQKSSGEGEPIAAE